MYAVAIIDDEADICDFVEEALQAPSVSVRRAKTAALGVQLLTNERFDLALIDVVLPDGSGIAVAEIALNEDIPVVLISGDLASIEGLVELGFPFLEKPFSLAALDFEAAQAIGDSGRYIRRASESIAKVRLTVESLGVAMADSRRLIEISRGLVDKAAACHPDG
jgi:DNA-binding NtrC family response regulator